MSMFKVISSIFFYVILGQNAQAVLKGMPDIYRAFPEVVQIGFQVSESEFGHCTATILGDYTLLTARHCVESFVEHDKIRRLIQINGKENSVMNVFELKEYSPLYKRFLLARQKIEKAKDSATVAEEDDIIEFELTHKQLIPFDVALIRTKMQIDKSIPRVTVSYKIQAQHIEVDLAGYGYTQRNDQGKFSGPNNLHYGSNVLFNYENHYLEIMGSFIDDNDTRALTALGDSGGPLFLKGTKIQVGVLRGGEYNLEYDLPSSVYVPLSRWKNFIQKNIK